MKRPPGATSKMRRGPVERPLPYGPPFSDEEQTVIELALREALAVVLRDGTFDPAHAEEKVITTKLAGELNRMLEAKPPRVKGFTKSIYQHVIRGGEATSSDGQFPSPLSKLSQNLEKRPDLAFRTQRRLPELRHPEHFALFVECKIVDTHHSMSDYGVDGIARFVDGRYAWAVTEGLMLGYARGDFALPDKLEEHFQRVGPKRYELVRGVEPREPPESHVFVTVHARSAVAVLPPDARGHIHLSHLWIRIA